MTISRDEWLKALGEAAQPVDPDALTTREIAAQFAISAISAWRRVQALVAAGRAVRTVKIVNGRRCPAYRLVSKPKRAA